MHCGLIVVHVAKNVDHLAEEELAGRLSHGTHGLVEVPEGTALDVLHHDEDLLVGDLAIRGLYQTLLAIVI